MSRAIRGNRRGAVTIFTALAIMVMIGAAALGVDVGMLTLSQRRLQGMADEAALAAASSSPDRRADAVARILAANDLPDVTSSIILGRYDANRAVAPADRFVSGTDAGALRVILHRRVPLAFGRILTGSATRTVAASAVARRIDVASFSMGTRLAAIRGGVPGLLMNALAGTDLSMSVGDYESLMSAKIGVLHMVQSLGTQINLTGASFDTILAAEVTMPALLRAMADSTGSPEAAALLRNMSVRVPGSTLQLRRLIDLGPLGDTAKAPSQDLFDIDAYSMLRESLSVANGRRQISLNLGGSIPGLFGTRVMLAVGERPISSPLLAVGQKGDVTARTAQQRLLIDTDIGLPLFGNMHLPLFVETASAQARLNAVSCSGEDQSVTVDVLPSPGTIAIAQIDHAIFDDMTRSPIIGPATLVQVPSARVRGYAKIDLFSDGAWQQVRFDRQDIANRTMRTVTSNSAAQGTANSLINQTDLRMEVFRYSYGVSGLPHLVGGAMRLAAPAVDKVIGMMGDLMGVHVGQADVMVNGIRCGVATLAA